MILYPGSSTVIEREFGEDEVAVTVVAKDFNGLTIPTSGLTKVDDTLWRFTLAIPQGAPVCDPASYYKLTWTHTGGKIEQEFQVVAYDEAINRPMPAAFGVAGIALNDEVYLPAGSTDITCEILSLGGVIQIAKDDGVVTPNAVSTPQLNSPGSIHASVDFPLPTITQGEYVAHWTYKVGAVTHHEFRQAFVISTRLTSIISNLRLFLDQSGVSRWLGNYHFHDVELIDCLYRGADRINAAPAQSTSFTPDTMPFGLVHALRTAALHEMLNRLYLAEGLNSFDFQGGSISVTVDRTQFIQTKMDELNSWLESNLVPTKNATLARSSIGHLHLSVSSGGNNNNYRGGGWIRPNAFQLSRQSGYGFL